MKPTIKSKIVRGSTMILLLCIMGYQSAEVKAQSFFSTRKKSSIHYRTNGYPINLGVELSLGMLGYQLESNIAALNGLQTRYFGFNAGGIVVNGHSKLKTTFGMFSSDDSVPYTIDVLQGSVVWTMYLLRTEEVSAHVFEPYLLLGANYLHSRFYGNYLSNDPTINMSNGNPPYLGFAGWVVATVGAGVEYQLENEDLKFIHLFLDARFGVPAITILSDRAFSQTVALGSVSCNFGINFALS